MDTMEQAPMDSLPTLDREYCDVRACRRGNIEAI